MKITYFILIAIAASFSHALAQPQTPAPITNNTPAGAAPVSMGKSMDNRQPLTDSQIVDIVKTANDADIDGGKFAEKKAKREDVKNFAKEMVKDHSDANAKLAQLLAKDKLRKQSNDTSAGMKKMSQITEKHLKEVKPNEFDSEYILAELTMHKEVLDSIDNDLIPNAKNDDLKAALKDARVMVSNHLEKAKAIQTAMTSGK